MFNQFRRAVPLFLAVGCCAMGQVNPVSKRGILLQDLTWIEAESVLKPDTVVVIPIGAESKEHGPHLPLKTDFIEAEYLKQRVLESANVVVATTVNYHYYPAFVEYPGSTTLRLETARDVIVDICRSLARYGPKRFYVLNTGVSTVDALKLSESVLAREGLLLRYTNIRHIDAEAERRITKQAGGTHADEIETSMMLYISPENVDMTKAVDDYHPTPGGGLTRDPKKPGAYSATGVYGNAKLATKEKGEIVINARVKGILEEIEALRAAALPTPR